MSWDGVDFRLIGDVLLIIPPGHRMNRCARHGGRYPRGGREQRPRTRRTRGKSSPRGDPDLGEADRPSLPVERAGVYRKRGGAS